MNAEKDLQAAQYILSELIETFQEGNILAFLLQLITFPFDYFLALID